MCGVSEVNGIPLQRLKERDQGQALFNIMLADRLYLPCHHQPILENLRVP